MRVSGAAWGSSTCRHVIESPTFWLVGDLLYLQSRSLPKLDLPVILKVESPQGDVTHSWGNHRIFFFINNVVVVYHRKCVCVYVDVVVIYASKTSVLSS